MIGIDNETLQEYGALTSWSRVRYAEVVDVLTEAGARVIAFDLLFAESGPGDVTFAAALERATAAGTNTVIGVSGTDRVPTDEAEVHFLDELRPVPVLAEAATHLAYVNAYPDADGTVRTNATIGETVGGEERLSFPLATYLAYFRVSDALIDTVVTVEEAAVRLPPNVSIPTIDGGLWYPNFYGTVAQDATFPVVPFHEVEDTPATLFEDKIVIVGLMDATGTVDLYPAPTTRIGEMMPGVELQAHAVASLLDGVVLQPQGRLSQVLTFVGLALFTALACAYLRWYGMVIAGVLIIVAAGVAASTAFTVNGIITNAFHPPLAVILAVMGSVGARVSLEVLGRTRAERALKSLVSMSEQRLDIGRIIPLIAGDARTMSAAESGGVWVVGVDGNPTLEVQTIWGDLLVSEQGEFCMRAFLEGTTQIEPGRVAVPVRWQRKVLAVIIVMGRRAQGAVPQLERFAERIAPSLENALLYTQTERQNQLLTRVLAESPAGILVLDNQLNLLRCNEAAATWLVIDPVSDVGKPMSFLLENSPMDEQTWRTIGDKLTTRGPFRMELKLAARTFRLDAAHIQNDGRWVVTMADITDLAELDSLKTRMIRMASHDLKNPIGRVLGYTELMQDLLEDDGMGDDYRHYTDRIVRSANEMLGLITDILDLEHIRSGRLQREPVDLLNMVRDVVQRHSDDMTEKEQTFESDLPDTLPVIQADYNQLVQAVSNVLGNAIKYTPRGGHIALLIRQRDDKIRLEVKDDGYGMPQESLDKLFTEFYRVRTEKTMQIEGTGLGLSLVKSIVEAHDGTIWVESELDAGSTFFIELPVEAEPVS